MTLYNCTIIHTHHPIISSHRPISFGFPETSPGGRRSMHWASPDHRLSTASCGSHRRPSWCCWSHVAALFLSGGFWCFPNADTSWDHMRSDAGIESSGQSCRYKNETTVNELHSGNLKMASWKIHHLVWWCSRVKPSCVSAVPATIDFSESNLYGHLACWMSWSWLFNALRWGPDFLFSTCRCGTLLPSHGKTWTLFPDLKMIWVNDHLGK